jgi:exodeoxyribonuclease-3
MARCGKARSRATTASRSSRAAPSPSRFDERFPATPTIRRRAIWRPPSTGILIACLYAPNGNPQPGPKFDYKLAWLARLVAHAKGLRDSGAPVVLAGDFNVVPTPADIYSTHSYDDDALVQPQSRAVLRKLLDQGWTDAIRVLHPKATIYTFWDYMRKRWDRNAGLRIDHLLLNAALSRRLVDAGVDKAVRGWPNASDHAPTWIEVE